MKVYWNGLLNRVDFLFTKGSDFVKERRLLSRGVVLLIITTLLVPALYFGGIRKASAHTSAPVQQAAPISAPPEPFSIGGSPTMAERLASSAASLLAFAAPTAKKEIATTKLVEPPAPPPPPSASQAALAALRLSPKNATGGTNLYSQNFGWETSLVSLPGRSGMNASLELGYNSLVWLKDSTNSEIDFDPDTSNVSPGFRIGFPVIEPKYTSTVTSLSSYLMITPDGRRIEFRDLGDGVTFGSADSTYALLNEVWSDVRGHHLIKLTVTTTDGTQMTYSPGNDWICTQIMDRNGNYFSTYYDVNNLLQTVTDTLGRVITINYDTGHYPTTITQTWKDTNGSGSNVTHTWATLSYTTATVSTSFSGLTNTGPANSSTLKVLDKITYPDGSFTKFDYNGYIQVKKISNVAADSTSHVLNYVSTNLDSPSTGQTDCPRFTQTKTWAENFNGGSEVVMNNSVTTGASYTLPDTTTATGTKIEIKTPDSTGTTDALVTRIYCNASGWAEGLPIQTEDYDTESSSLVKKRWTWTAYTQDNTGVGYITNPRATETRVGDGTNTKRTTIGYGSNGYGLPELVKVYDTDLTTVLKTQTTTYDLDSAYTSRRIIGLPAETDLWQGVNSSGTLMSKVTYAYDEGSLTGTDPVQDISPTQHDGYNYGSSFVTGRGLLTSTTRWDATAPTTSGSAVTSSIKYNTAGSRVSQTDPLSHTVKIDYTDNFNWSPVFSTYAYPTTVTDPAGNNSTAQYRYDLGANIATTGPAPAGQTYGKTIKHTFDDSYGRIAQDSIYVNTTLKAYARHEFPTNGIESKSFTTIVDTDTDGPDTDDEVLTDTWTDGAGRVRGSRTENPSSTGGWTANLTEYNILGQVSRTSVPTEISVSSPYDPAHWTAAGDDSTAGFLWTYQKYDWKGRVTRKINTDGTDSSTLNDSDVLISYDGCGCAGGQVTTIQGENVPIPGSSSSARRMQKVYEDIRGRNVKSETYAWDGTTVYGTVVNTYNGRDQVTNARVYDGSTSSSTYQDTTSTFDGHGRLSTQHIPEQDTSTVTTYNYNTDDSISSVTDARGAVTNLTYNSRGLLTEKSWTVPGGSGITVPATVDFTYDNVGNRTAMTDGLGGTTYSYDSLSELTSETRSFSDSSPSFYHSYTFNYGYTLTGQLATFSDPDDTTRNLTYAHDKIGRTTGLTGNGFASVYTYASSLSYRAFGGLKSMTYGSSSKVLTNTFNNRLQLASYDVSGSTLGSTNTYNADGRVKTASDTYDNHFDRLYQYDNVGRVVDAKSGLEARSTSTTDDRPYRETYGYNAFSDLTSRTGKIWATDVGSISKTYTNGRDQTSGSTFDADGRQTGEVNAVEFGGRTNYYDASGQRYKTTWPGMTGAILHPHMGTLSVEQTFDGDGNRIKQIENIRFHPGTSYEVRSSLLGIVYEVSSGGTKTLGNVYLNGKPIAYQNIGISNTVTENYQNPATGSQRGAAETEPDPLGVDAGLSAPEEDPGDYTDTSTSDLISRKFDDAYNLNSGCSLDGQPMSCDMVINVLISGAGKVTSSNSSWSGFGLFRIPGKNDAPPPPGAPADPSTDTDDDMIHGPDTYGTQDTYTLFDVRGPRQTRKTISKPTFDQIKDAFIDCVRRYWGERVKINSISGSAKGINGEINLTYVNGEHKTMTDTIINDATTLNGIQLLTLVNSRDLGVWVHYGPSGSHSGPPTQGVNGATFPLSINRISGTNYGFTPLYNYTANDNSNQRFPGLAGAIGGFLYEQFHEGADSIGELTGVRIGDPNKIRGDDDSGQRITKCLADKFSGGE